MSDLLLVVCKPDHPLEAYYRTLLESLKELAKELRLVQATGNSLFAVARIGSQVRAPDMRRRRLGWLCTLSSTCAAACNNLDFTNPIRALC